VKAADTSVAVAAFASWHEFHDRARKAPDSGVRLIDHCSLETYSVLPGCRHLIDPRAAWFAIFSA
jgi:hypothetical protein